MRILISGSGGLIGSHLWNHFQNSGHEVQTLVRRQAMAGEIAWAEITKSKSILSGFDVVIHLSGENIGHKRWTPGQKRKILQSRTESTARLAKALAGVSSPPKTFLCASATGIYGDRGDEILNEDSPPGESFLSDVCRQWEAATQPAGEAGIRLVNLRFGMVLSVHGGALASLKPLFKLGLGGRIGSGSQYMSWLSLTEIAAIIDFIIRNKQISGPVNMVAPEAVTNTDFTRILARTLKRPAPFIIPAAVLKLVRGQMAEELILYSTRAAPARLISAGYKFRFAALEPCLTNLLNRGE